MKSLMVMKSIAKAIVKVGEQFEYKFWKALFVKRSCFTFVSLVFKFPSTENIKVPSKVSK